MMIFSPLRSQLIALFSLEKKQALLGYDTLSMASGSPVCISPLRATSSSIAEDTESVKVIFMAP